MYKMEEAKKIGLKKVINDWIDKKLNAEYIIAVKGHLVRSVSETIISNFLFKHGIEYKYEKLYPKLVEDRKPYKPDFTLDLAGQKVYFEYFGMDDRDYKEKQQKKIALQQKYKTNFFYIENARIDQLENILDMKLKNMGLYIKIEQI